MPDELRHDGEVDHRFWPERHNTSLGYPSVVAGLSSHVDVRFIAMRRIGDPYSHDFFTSEWGTLGTAMVSPIDDDESLVVVSMAAAYNAFTCESGSPRHRRWRLGYPPTPEHPSDGDLEQARGPAFQTAFDRM